MAIHRIRDIDRWTLRATGALLAGMALSGCAPSIPHNSAHAPTEVPPSAPPVSPPTTSTPPPATQYSLPPTADTPTNQGSRSAPPSASPADRCHTSMLAATLQGGDTGGAGHIGATLSLRDVSSRSCTVYGYAGLQLLDQNGRPLPTHLQRTTGTPPKLVRLDPGDSVSATLLWSDINSADEPDYPGCEPTPVRVLITPPDETDPLTAPWTMGAVCQHGALSINAFPGD